VPCAYRYLNFHLAIQGIRTIHPRAIEYLKLRDPDFTPTQSTVHEAVSKTCTQFPDSYWADLDASHTFPIDFHQAFAKDGWLDIRMTSAYGGSDLGIAETAVMV
jgi:alkylation response protein AidB-like acyl-CoA dehydrogenase